MSYVMENLNYNPLILDYNSRIETNTQCSRQ